MSISRDEYRRARHITKDASQLLLEAIRPDKRGRPTLDPSIFLTGMVLCMDRYNRATVTQIHRLLTTDLPVDLQFQLGVRRKLHTGGIKTVSEADLYRLTQRITRRLDHTKTRAGALGDKERYSRRAALDAVVQALIDATLIPRPDESADYALDGTGLWAAERAPYKRSSSSPPEPEHEEDFSTVSAAARISSDPAPPGTTATANDGDITNETNNTGTENIMNIDRERSRGRKGPSDATYGAKTHKEGHTDWFFGYDVEALVRVPLRKVDDPTQRPEPILLERLLVLPASTDIVDPCLRMIDSLHDAGGKVRRLLVDRHYSYKLYKRWLLQLHKRGVRQVCDLHEKDQGFRDWDGMKMAAAWPHCPATPDHLGTIPSLPPNATQAQVQQFTARIGERQAYAAQRIGEDLSKGITRWSCPARNGTIGCPLREGTVATAIANGLPVVVNPPGRGERPTLCRQRTVQITTRPDNTAEARVMKPYQKHYWGTQEWRRDYNRRTFVEGWFGVLKNDNATGLDRGSHQFRGLPLVTLVIACAAAINNMRLLRTWHTETQNGDLSHPLVQADETFHGYVQLTQLQAAQIADDARTDAA